MGAKSYAQKGIEWINEGRYPFTVDESQTSTATSIHDRSWGWIFARQKKNEKGDWEIPLEQAQEVVKRIEKVREDVAEGKFIPHRQDDILSRGLKRVDRAGRVSGIGGTVGHRAYFGRPEYKSGGSSSTEVDLESLTQYMERKLEDRVRHILQSMGVNLPSDTDTERGSEVDRDRTICQRDHSFDNLLEPTPCYLSLHYESNKEMEVVAVGSVMPTSSAVTHGLPRNPNDVRVTVDKVKPEYRTSTLPIPSTELYILGDAEGSFVRWPKSLVIIKEDDTSLKRKLVDDNGLGLTKKVKEVEDGEYIASTVASYSSDSGSCELSDVCSRLKLTFSNDSLLKLLLDKDVFAYKQNATTYVTTKDVTDLLTDRWLNVTILSVWIMCLNKRCLEKNLHTIKLLCPEENSAANISRSLKDQKEMEDYVKDVMKASEGKQFILGPYYENNHWMLFAICPSLSRVYVFDPKKRSEN